MDSEISRWSQIVFWDKDQLDGLHHREQSLARRCGPSNTPLFMQQGKATWEDLELIAKTTKIFNPGGKTFWPEGMDSSAQYRSMDDFTRAIYPIWKGIEAKDKEAEAALSLEMMRVKGQVLFECLTMHRQDRAIHAKGIKPSREVTAPADFRKKAAASDKFASWRAE